MKFKFVKEYDLYELQDSGERLKHTYTKDEIVEVDMDIRSERQKWNFEILEEIIIPIDPSELEAWRTKAQKEYADKKAAYIKDHEGEVYYVCEECGYTSGASFRECPTCYTDNMIVKRIVGENRRF